MSQETVQKLEVGVQPEIRIANVNPPLGQGTTFGTFVLPSAAAGEQSQRGALIVLAGGQLSRTGAGVARRACEAAVRRYCRSRESDAAKALQDAVQAANAAVRRHSLRRGAERAPAALLCVAMSDGTLTLAGTGFGNVYLIHGNEIRRVESAPGNSIAFGAAAATAPTGHWEERRRVQPNLLGVQPRVEVAFSISALEPGDALVVYVDGPEVEGADRRPIAATTMRQVVRGCDSVEEAIEQLGRLFETTNATWKGSALVAFYGPQPPAGVLPRLRRRFALNTGTVGLLMSLGVLVLAYVASMLFQPSLLRALWANEPKAAAEAELPPAPSVVADDNLKNGPSVWALSPTPTASPEPTKTPRATATPTATPTKPVPPSPTSTPRPPATPTATKAPPTRTPTATNTATRTASPTATTTQTATASPTATNVPASNDGGGGSPPPPPTHHQLPRRSRNVSARQPLGNL